LKLLSRVTSPTEGTIKIKGKIASLLEVGTGFNGELTGRENIYLNGAILGMKKRQIDRKLEEIIDFSGIEHHIDTPVKRYSSGMYVRLAFAVAAHLDSEILIADEVLAVGDAEFQKKALGKMQDLSTGQGRTVLFVSHNIGAVTSLCTKGLVLNNGRLILSGNLDNCINTYLKSGNQTETQGLWNGFEGDENLRLTKVSLQKNNFFSAQYLRNDILKLTIEYEVILINPEYVFCIEICNLIGTVLCESSATEYFSKDLSIINSIGKHSLELMIDCSIFAQGKYYIKFDLAIRDIKRIIPDNFTIPFYIENNEKENTNYVPKRSNIICPNWEWKILI